MVLNLIAMPRTLCAGAAIRSSMQRRHARRERFAFAFERREAELTAALLVGRYRRLKFFPDPARFLVRRSFRVAGPAACQDYALVRAMLVLEHQQRSDAQLFEHAGFHLGQFPPCGVILAVCFDRRLA